jgi:hypothetical protein
MGVRPCAARSARADTHLQTRGPKQTQKGCATRAPCSRRHLAPSSGRVVARPLRAPAAPAAGGATRTTLRRCGGRSASNSTPPSSTARRRPTSSSPKSRRARARAGPRERARPARARPPRCCHPRPQATSGKARATIESQVINQPKHASSVARRFPPRSLAQSAYNEVRRAAAARLPPDGAARPRVAWVRAAGGVVHFQTGAYHRALVQARPLGRGAPRAACLL